MNSPTLLFATLIDATYTTIVEDMMAALYIEDPSSHPVDQSIFRRTIETLIREPTTGRIILFVESGDPVGYAILLPYWSNEYGGRLVVVDELFVLPEHRGRGIATAFFGYLREARPYEARGIALEVTPANARARKLYTSLGFTQRKNSLHVCTWDALKARTKS
jgi:GNAT superfamily N-acetyltransferase